MLKDKFSIDDVDEVFDIVVRREEEFFLSDTLKRMRKPAFKPTKQIIVRFYNNNTFTSNIKLIQPCMVCLTLVGEQ